jgi:hypothetical protein
MNLTIHPKKVLLDGHDLLTLRESERFLTCFGNPSRRRDIPMHPSGTRVAMVWDQLGFVAYEDRPEGLMSHFILAFDPKETPEHPNHACKSAIEINGGIVTAETLERTLPQNGPTPISADLGKHFFYETDAYSVHFIFKREANPHGKHIITGRLVSVSFSWRKHAAVRPNKDS